MVITVPSGVAQYASHSFGENVAVRATSNRVPKRSVGQRRWG